MVEEIIELLDNPRFKSWVWFPSQSLDQYWNQILADSPQKREPMQKARYILEALTKEFQVDFPEPETVNKMLRKILSTT